MSLHIYAAKNQPATRFCDDFGRRRRWLTRPGGHLLPTYCCHKDRPARNLYAQVYYDGVRFVCRPTKGCAQ